LNAVFGASVPRLEDGALVRGAGRFVADLNFPHTLVAAFVRSPHGHAAINSIDAREATELAGVAAVLTLADLRPFLTDDRMADGMPAKSSRLDARRPILAGDEVVYVGEPVALVLADSRYIAEDAAELVEVDYVPLPAVSDCRDALAVGSARVHSRFEDNLLAEFDFDYGDLAAAFDTSALVFRETIWQHRGCGHSLEARGVVARYDEQEQRLTLWNSTQTPHACKRLLCDLLGRDDDAVRVVTPDVGGGFGPKLVSYPEEIGVAIAAQITGRPIKWIEDRREHFVATTQERDQFWEVEIAVNDEAEIRGIRGSLLHDHGAYTARGVNVPYASASTLPLLYNVPAYHMDIRVALTNKVPVAPVRGAGYPQAAFVMERLLDRVARELNLDRGEVRRRNLVRADQIPCEKPLKLRGGNNIVLDSGDYPAMQHRVLEHVGWDSFGERRTAARAEGRYLGIGLANFIKGTGRGPFETVKVRIKSSGMIAIATGAAAMGQSTSTMLAQIVAEQLGGDMACVTVTTGDTDAVTHGFGGFNSRQAVVAGASAHAAALKVRAQILEAASDLLKASQGDLEIQSNRVVVRGVPDQGISFAQLARTMAGAPGFKLPGNSGPGLEATEQLVFDDMTFATGSVVAEVEVDIETAAVTIQRVTIGHDCGRMINPQLVEGQIMGGVAHAVGNALYEWMGFDDNAQPITTTFADYLLITAAEMPPVDILHHGSPTPLNALGVKGVGESGSVSTAAAVVSAVEDALSHLRSHLDHSPLLPGALLDKIREGAEVP